MSDVDALSQPPLTTAAPLDIGGMGAPAPRDHRKELLKLAMVIPLALKAGPGAIQGFLANPESPMLFGNSAFYGEGNPLRNSSQ